MSQLSQRLARPRAGVAVLVVAVVVIILVAAAAYHGSSSGSPCPSARGLLGRVAADVRAVSGGHATAPQLAALARDDDDVNNFINAAQHPDPTFNGRILPLAENLGRVVTDFQQKLAVIGDLNALESAAASASGYCA